MKLTLSEQSSIRQSVARRVALQGATPLAYFISESISAWSKGERGALYEFEVTIDKNLQLAASARFVYFRLHDE